MNNLHIRNLSRDDFKEMHNVFNRAFSDYAIPVYLTFDQFEKRILKKLNIDFQLSAGAFNSNKLVGFIFTGVGVYEGKKVAYNGGTGVIPEFRGNQLTLRLYQYLFPKFIENQIQSCVLEVINLNQKALHVYKKIGFRESKLLHCFRKGIDELYANEEQLQNIKIIKTPDWQLFKKFSESSPSFLDSFDVIKRNIDNEDIIVYEIDDKIAGYAIYQPELGRISQLGVDKKKRRSGIGTALVQYMIKNSETIALTVMNIDTKNQGFIQFLNQSGFENQLDQYEMQLNLSF